MESCYVFFSFAWNFLRASAAPVPHLILSLHQTPPAIVMHLAFCFNLDHSKGSVGCKKNIKHQHPLLLHWGVLHDHDAKKQKKKNDNTIKWNSCESDYLPNWDCHHWKPKFCSSDNNKIKLHCWACRCKAAALGFKAVVPVFHLEEKLAGEMQSGSETERFTWCWPKPPAQE